MPKTVLFSNLRASQTSTSATWHMQLGGQADFNLVSWLLAQPQRSKKRKAPQARSTNLPNVSHLVGLSSEMNLKIYSFSLPSRLKMSYILDSWRGGLTAESVRDLTKRCIVQRERGPQNPRGGRDGGATRTAELFDDCPI